MYYIIERSTAVDLTDAVRKALAKGATLIGHPSVAMKPETHEDIKKVIFIQAVMLPVESKNTTTIG